MKRKLALILIIILNSLSCSETKKEDSQNLTVKNGILYNVKSNEPFTGVDRLYDENGQLWMADNYKDGKREGVSKFYYENGQLESIVFYRNDKREGKGKFYDENGQLESEDNYKNGKKEGLAKLYYENGQLMIEENYKNGKQEGLDMQTKIGVLVKLHFYN